MAGRFPLFTDENIDGPLVLALQQAGWDVEHAAHVFGERTDDAALFAYAAEHGRVLVTTDRDHLRIAAEWMMMGRVFRLLYWRQDKTQRISVSVVIAAFEALAADEKAFSAGIEYLRLPA